MRRSSKAAVAAALAAVVTTLVPTTQVAHAALQVGQDSAAAAARISSHPTRFRGTLLDGAGRPVDDLVVEAFRTDSTTSDPNASAITYDNWRFDRHHGGFDLYVKQGTFRLLVTGRDSLGHQLFQPRWIGGPSKIWAINSQQRITLPDVKLAPIGTFASTSTVAFDPSNNVRVGRRLTIVAKVACRQISPVGGRVTYVVDGEPLTRRTVQNGRAFLDLTAQEAGVHSVQIQFEGGPHVQPSTSQTYYFSVSRRRG